MNKTERVRQGGSHIIGRNIRRLREQKHLRNSDLVAKLQLEGIPISTSTLSKIEQGTCNPSTEQLVALQKIFLRVVPSLLTSPCHIPYAARRAHSPLGGVSFSKSSQHITRMLFRSCLSA